METPAASRCVRCDAILEGSADASGERAACLACAAHRRLVAAKLCRTAFYLAIGTAAVYAMGFPFAIPLAVPLAGVAAGMGLLGLGRLAVADRGPALDASHAGRERYAARRVRAAPREAWIAILVGGGICVGTVLLFLLAPP